MFHAVRLMRDLMLGLVGVLLAVLAVSQLVLPVAACGSGSAVALVCVPLGNVADSFAVLAASEDAPAFQAAAAPMDGPIVTSSAWDAASRALASLCRRVIA